MKVTINLNDGTNNKVTKVNETDTLEFIYEVKDLENYKNDIKLSVNAITSEGEYIKGTELSSCGAETTELKNVILKNNFNNKSLKNFFKNNDYNTRKIFILPVTYDANEMCGTNFTQYIHIIELEGESAKDIIKRKDNTIIGISISFSLIILLIIIIIYKIYKKFKTNKMLGS